MSHLSLPKSIGKVIVLLIVARSTKDLEPPAIPGRFRSLKAKDHAVKYLATLALLTTLVTPAAAAPHQCADDAIAHAKELLRLHFLFDEIVANKPDSIAKKTFSQLPNWSIDDKVKQLSSIRALKGKGKLDVLEVYGYIYKASYRMRFIYAQGDGCTLMGQEILEASDPY
jgi:hypothetical protein